MTLSTRSYGSRSVKRHRRTKAEMESIRDAIFISLYTDHPQTIRQLFYRLTVDGVIAKTEAEYKTVVRLTGEMRRAGALAFEWIADSTRWMRKPRTFDSLEAALQITAQTYRRSLWAESSHYVEIWIEKEALAGVLVDVTHEFDVPLMVTRGYPSISFVQSAAEAMNERDQLTFVYYLGDHDPSGVDISRKLEEDLNDFTDGLVEFERIAVTSVQIEWWQLPSRPTKKTDTRARNFGGESVELDAIPAPELRELVRDAIEDHVDAHQLHVLRTVEAEERRVLVEMAASFNGGRP
jgi:DNA-binding PadR family transcriptional regulator